MTASVRSRRQSPQPRFSSPPVKPTTDRRYRTARWQRVRLLVLVRDLYRCFVPGCQVRANVADHITPVYPGMPDWEFFGPPNLRASCRSHNLARGFAIGFAADMGATEPTTESAHSAPRRTIFKPRLY